MNRHAAGISPVCAKNSSPRISERFGRSDDLLIGLQLTHSGRFSPAERKAPPWNRGSSIAIRCSIRGSASATIGRCCQTTRLPRLPTISFARPGWPSEPVSPLSISSIVTAISGTNFLSAVDRPGRYGGSLENRTRFLRDIVAGIRAEAPGLEIGVRVSVFDFRPLRAAHATASGVPGAAAEPYRYAFGADAGDGPGASIFANRRSYSRCLKICGSNWFARLPGSPYYNPHILRPAAFPPSDGYRAARRSARRRRPADRGDGLAQSPASAAHICRLRLHLFARMVAARRPASITRRRGGLHRRRPDGFGISRFPADVLAGRPLERKRLCRTFSDCTTAPRNGLVSGCYPLDPFYKSRPERAELDSIQKEK